MVIKLNRIKQLRAEKKYSQQQLADRIKVARSTIAMWETGGSEPDNTTLLQLADIFGVSTDYLLGKTDEKKADTSEDVSAEFLASLSPETQKIYALIQQLNDLPEQTRREAMNYIRYVIDRSQSQPPEKKGDQ